MPFYLIFGIKINLINISFISPPYFNKSVYYFVLACETTNLWIAIIGSGNAWIDGGTVDDVGFFYMILGVPFTIVAF